MTERSGMEWTTGGICWSCPGPLDRPTNKTRSRHSPPDWRRSPFARPGPSTTTRQAAPAGAICGSCPSRAVPDCRWRALKKIPPRWRRRSCKSFFEAWWWGRTASYSGPNEPTNPSASRKYGQHGREWWAAYTMCGRYRGNRASLCRARRLRQQLACIGSNCPGPAACGQSRCRTVIPLAPRGRGAAIGKRAADQDTRSSLHPGDPPTTPIFDGRPVGR